MSNFCLGETGRLETQSTIVITITGTTVMHCLLLSLLLSPSPSFSQHHTLIHTLSFPPVNKHRDRQAIANSFGSISSSLTLPTPPSSPLFLSLSLSPPLISVGSPGIIRQFQSSPARFTLFCGHWPACHTHIHGHTVTHTHTQKSHSPQSQRSGGGHDCAAMLSVSHTLLALTKEKIRF